MHVVSENKTIKLKPAKATFPDVQVCGFFVVTVSFKHMTAFGKIEMLRWKSTSRANAFRLLVFCAKGCGIQKGNLM